MRKIFLPLILIASLLLIGCAREETPEEALKEIKASIEQFDYDKFSARVDVKNLLGEAYEDSTVELAMRSKEFHARYPDDPFFSNSSEDIIMYNELHREDHMKFVRAVVEACFDQKLVAPHDFKDNTVEGTASELRHYYSTAQSTIESVMIESLRAEMKISLSVESLYTNKKYEVPLVLEFEKYGEHWQIKKIKNVGEIIAATLDIAEVLWVN